VIYYRCDWFSFCLCGFDFNIVFLYWFWDIALFGLRRFMIWPFVCSFLFYLYICVLDSINCQANEGTSFVWVLHDCIGFLLVCWPLSWWEMLFTLVFNLVFPFVMPGKNTWYVPNMLVNSKPFLFREVISPQKDLSLIKEQKKRSMRKHILMRNAERIRSSMEMHRQKVIIPMLLQLDLRSQVMINFQRN